MQLSQRFLNFECENAAIAAFFASMVFKFTIIENLFSILARIL